ncbi:MAG: YicC family protein [Bacteroidetes bacterium RIFOXYA12_FULL_35_11]|nr:MAG: YicC family protein [Bacteroidetes bacterium GWF2_35_48]OFY79304.1 MAG: YicC family protein [Bacteroidetes bacterium RIFOXYA12_FULL_35_11]OFY93639.1 MAG: YicC family protein [Bacteroidetes bacterium RIFOXYC12_FULL_35_7]HBX51946.1 YicC family protein [Bacteroidales bacterium]
MIKSMTGYGKASTDFFGKKITVEAKSINSKQLDLNFKMPFLYKEKELDLRNEISRVLDRGKIEMILTIDAGDNIRAATINKELVKQYCKQLKDIANEIEQVNFETIFTIATRLPDVVKTDAPELDKDEWENVLTVFTKAIKQLDETRIKEGKILEQDFIQRIKLIENFLNAVSPFEEKRIENIRSRINQNLEDAVGKDKIDMNRFEQELIYYLEKIDITEEKVRLANHLNYFIETLNKEDLPGKKLSFITQEIGREINTLGSKANDVDIQKLVIRMKDELEKIKEQLMNVL